ncbi:MAG: hypothetical protein ACOYVD_14220 [Bacillota bacterium]
MYGSYGALGVNCIWNNAEGLIGDDESHIVCKTMLRVPPNFPAVKAVVKANGRVFIKEPIFNIKPDTVAGEIQVNFSYKPTDFPLGNGEDDRDFTDPILPMSIVIPFETTMDIAKEEKVFSRIKYLKAQRVGMRNILLETVIYLARYNHSSRRIEGSFINQVFSRSCVLKIDYQHPAVAEPLTAQVVYNVTHSSFKDGVLHLSGWKENYLIYEGVKDIGERVLIHHQTEPFDEEIYCEEALSFDIPPKITCENLTLELLNNREVLLEGDYNLIMERLFEPQQEDVQEKLIEEKLQEEIEENPPIIDIMPDSIIIKDENEKKQDIIEKAEEKMAAALPRESKRAKLQKHMRDKEK